jgi:hypothetical protein
MLLRMDDATKGFVYNHEDEGGWFNLPANMQEGDVEVDDKDDDDTDVREIENIPDTHSEGDIHHDEREDETALSREYF